jgi:hypothetical protein
MLGGCSGKKNETFYISGEEGKEKRSVRVVVGESSAQKAAQRETHGRKRKWVVYFHQLLTPNILPSRLCTLSPVLRLQLNDLCGTGIQGKVQFVLSSKDLWAAEQ